MASSEVPDLSKGEPALKSEITRLNKIVRALMDRAELSTTVQGSDFSLFQTAIMLEERVRQRTMELEAALRENEKVNHALRDSEMKFRGLVNQSLVGIYMIQDGKFSYSNPKFDEICGYTTDEMRELSPLDIVAERDRPLVAENLHKRIAREIDHVHYAFHGLRKNGTEIDVEVFGSTMEIGSKIALIGLALDVTERARAEHEVKVLQDRLREESIHDGLTGLYNRRYLEETLKRELISAEREGHPVSVIMGDLDHFKAVNDRYGHLAGDEVLRVFGALMKSNARGSDIYCRYGGEEFVLVLPGMARDKAAERAEQLRSAMAAVPVLYGTTPIIVTASFGVATFPRDGSTGDDLIAAADRALYVAKAAGRNRVTVSSGPIQQRGPSVLDRS
jgi:diguanylate cyclase (GGDEF)-like protein/PAS domain S-box-containing protein